MTALHHALSFQRCLPVLLLLTLHCAALAPQARAVNITIDYRYDTGNFFNTQQKKNALQAAADRYSAVITESLTAATLSDNNEDPRIGFTHPGTGSYFEVSPANSPATDGLATCAGCYPANEYRGQWSLAANQMVLYAGGRPLATAAEGGNGTGLNWTNVFDEGSSHLNRGFRFSGSENNLPMWGGSIAFNTGTTWHFNHTTAAPAGTTDFYSIALHEIGHVLGLGTSWDEWQSLSSGSQFFGPNSVTAYNTDNGTSVSALNRVSSADPHFQDGAYNSYIFQNATPNLVGTVGTSVHQDLMMEPTAHFSGAIRRFELTNVDVAALRDVGWSTVPQITTQPGDYNNDGTVDAADFVVWRKGVANGTDTTWRANFGEGAPGAFAIDSSPLAPVPEPASWLILATAFSAMFFSRRAPRNC